MCLTLGMYIALKFDEDISVNLVKLRRNVDIGWTYRSGLKVRQGCTWVKDFPGSPHITMFQVDTIPVPNLAVLANASWCRGDDPCPDCLPVTKEDRE